MERSLKWREQNENDQDLFFFAPLVQRDAGTSSITVQSNSSTSHIYNFFPPLSTKRHRQPNQNNNNNNNNINPPETLDSLLQTFLHSSRLPPPKRRRRETVYDKTRVLKKLLPSCGPHQKKKKNINMDSVSILEEAYEYLKFLQAQVKSLRAMPFFYHSGFNVGMDTSSFEGLELLTWQRLLKIVLDSPANETRLYSSGCCVFSFNQLGSFQPTSPF